MNRSDDKQREGFGQLVGQAREEMRHSGDMRMAPGLRRDIVKRLRDLHLITCAADNKDSRHNETLASIAADIIEQDSVASATRRSMEIKFCPGCDKEWS